MAAAHGILKGEALKRWVQGGRASLLSVYFKYSSSSPFAASTSRRSMTSQALWT